MDPFATNTSSTYGQPLGQQSPSSHLTTNRLQLPRDPSSFRTCRSTRIALIDQGLKWVNRFLETRFREFRNMVSHKGFAKRLELGRKLSKFFDNFPIFVILQAPAPASQPGGPAGVPKKATAGAENVKL